MKFKEARQAVASEGGKFMKLQEGPNKVRIVSEALQMWKVFDGKNSTTFLDPEEQKPEGAKMKFAMYVIDRATTEIKILEAGASIIGQLGDFAETEDYKFDDLPPYDITIIKEGSGMDTEYKVVPSRANTELTPEEQAKVLAMPSLEEHYGAKPSKSKGDEIPF